MDGQILFPGYRIWPKLQQILQFSAWTTVRNWKTTNDRPVKFPKREYFLKFISWRGNNARSICQDTPRILDKAR